ncbi:hypothetical protein CAEBREN_00579 [Caenorhabditis brenneri]|uniref:BTB domain-containing protein n=1 Tax=Caenorhabditis brenneri TaxID=135651 RepID=G0NIU8_CAEBE|nr:hypothetical protein CAEBREN_00579 [Caenorhabditis brenneri]
MSERSKYALNGVYKCEDFEQNLATGQFPEHDIGYSPWNSEVYITFKTREELNQVFPYIAFARKQKHKIRAFFNIKSKFWSLCYQTNGSFYLESGVGVSGPSISIQDVLNEENGYLESGALTVEYGLQVEGIQGRCGVWMFNFQNRLFGDRNSSFLFVNGGQTIIDEFFCPKPLLSFHSPLFTDECKKYAVGNWTDTKIEDFLQIANGVRFVLSVYDSSCIIEFAQQFGLRNVVQYCDQLLVQEYPKHMVPKYKLKGAILFNMRHIVARLIQQWGFKELLKELRDDLDEIPGEMLKVITRKFINEEF